MLQKKPNMSDDVLSDDEALESEMLHVEIPELKGGKMSEDTAQEEVKMRRLMLMVNLEKGNICQKIRT